MLNRGSFSEQYNKTVGVDFLEKVQHVPSLRQDIKIMLWDTAGQEVFDSVTRSYYRGAAAAAAAAGSTVSTLL
jgi:Ras-related protein Rab-23